MKFAESLPPQIEHSGLQEVDISQAYNDIYQRLPDLAQRLV